MKKLDTAPNALFRAWQRTLRRCGHQRALVEAATGATCTFAELEARSCAWVQQLGADAAELAARAVVFALPNGPRWLEVFLGLQRLGAVAVPLDGAEPPVAQRATAETLRAAAWWDGEKLVRLPFAKRYRDPEICLIKLTSGTTGRPRPLVFTAAQMLADARQVTSTMEITARDLNYALIPFGHSYGLGNLTLPLLAQGVPLVCGTAALPQAIADDVARWLPTVFPTVPAVLRGLVTADIAPEKLASVRNVISAGAPLASDTARAFAEKFGRRVHAFYGSSETGGIAYDRDGAATLAGSVGRAMRGVKIKPKAAQRIEVRSAAVFTLGNTRTMRGLGTWSPADRVQIARDGRLTLLGRRGATVKIAGRRVNLGEVAARLRRLGGVREVWVDVGGVANETVLGAAVATARALPELRAELMHDTATWKIPKRWALMPEFPITARGKVDARSLRARVFG